MIAVPHADSSCVTPDPGRQKQEAQTSRRLAVCLGVSSLATSSRLNSISQQFRLQANIASWKWLQFIVQRPDGCAARPASLSASLIKFSAARWNRSYSSIVATVTACHKP
jgi:hypothetical protein